MGKKCSVIYIFKMQEYLQEHLAPDIISHYVMHGPGVAEVVKSLIISLRKKNEDVSDIFLGALKQVNIYCFFFFSKKKKVYLMILVNTSVII